MVWTRWPSQLGIQTEVSEHAEVGPVTLELQLR
jgi:hypothetical protein